MVDEEIANTDNAVAIIDDFDLDSLTEEVEKVLNSSIIEDDLDNISETEMSIGELADMEMENVTNLLIQEMVSQSDGNISEVLTFESTESISSDNIWSE